MPSLNNTTDSFHSGHPRRIYITTSAFNNDFYLYTVTRNPTTYVQTGTLSAVVGATAANCPANRILRENGRRLYKDANPGISTLLVGVYDAVSGLSGLIDPNSARFAVYNGDKSVFQDNGVDPNGGLVDQGPPIYTRGSVTAGAGITTTGGLTVNGGAVVGKVTTSTTGPTGTLTLDLSTANVFYYSTAVAANTVFAVTNATVGTVFKIALLGGAFTVTLPTNVYAATTGVTFTTANVTPVLTANVRYLFECVVVA